MIDVPILNEFYYCSAGCSKRGRNIDPSLRTAKLLYSDLWTTSPETWFCSNFNNIREKIRSQDFYIIERSTWWSFFLEFYSSLWVITMFVDSASAKNTKFMDRMQNCKEYCNPYSFFSQSSKKKRTTRSCGFFFEQIYIVLRITIICEFDFESRKW